jgi:hypothetical protein
MKIFISTFLFIAATLFPILFFPLLAGVLLYNLIFSPQMVKNGFGFWGSPKNAKLSVH